MVIFVAGSTGATGQVFVPMATEAKFDLRIHVRPQTAPKTPLGKDLRARIFDLREADRLNDALAGCGAVISLVGTMRSRFKEGDTYESSDLGSTRALVDGALAAKVPRFVLLSSLGAGGMGAYLKMKGECERMVRESSLRYTIFRPSALLSPKGQPLSHHGPRQVPAVVGWIMSALGSLKPMPIPMLCRAILKVLHEPRDSLVLEGREIWALAR